jgi:hypothetical protein
METFINDLKNAMSQLNNLIDEYIETIPKSEPIPEQEPYEPITPEQEEEIRYLCKDYPEMIKEMLDRLRLQDLEYMPKKEYREHIERLRKIIDTRKKLPN